MCIKLVGDANDLYRIPRDEFYNFALQQTQNNKTIRKSIKIIIIIITENWYAVCSMSNILYTYIEMLSNCVVYHFECGIATARHRIL